MSLPYLDTGFALKRYVQEPNSPAAKAALLAFTPPLPLTDLLEMELVNALHGKVFRNEMTQRECDQCLANFESDIAAGFWERCDLNASRLRFRFMELSHAHTAATGTRTLDLLHVAAAQELQADVLLSFDNKQRAAALAAGLTVRP